MNSLHLQSVPALGDEPVADPAVDPAIDPAADPIDYEQVLAAFKEIAREATAVRTPQCLDTLLRLVGQRICELISVRRCSVYLRAQGGLFHGQVGYCESDSIDDRIKPLISGVDGDRFTQEIVAGQVPVLVTDACHDERTMQRTMRRWGVRDMLGVPLVFNGEVIGIIYIDDLQNEHLYTEQDLRVTQTFASLAALAIRQASLFSQLNHRASVIDEQRQILEQATEAHERLTRAVLSGLGLDEIVGLLAELLGKPVFAYNAYLTLMAQGAPGGSPVHESLERAARGSGAATLTSAVGRAELSKPSIILAPAAPSGCAYRRLVCPMTAEGHPSGYLVVLEVGRRFTPLDVRIGQHGATVLTLQMFTELRQSAARSHAREDFLGDLLHGGRDPEGAERRSRMVGVNLAHPHVIVRVGGNNNAGSAAERRLAIAALIKAEMGLSDVISTGVPGASVYLVAVDDDHDLAAARRVKAAVKCALERYLPDAPPSAVVSRVCRGLRDYPKAGVELRRVMEMLDRLGRAGQVELASELGVLRLLSASVPHPMAVEFAKETLAPLAAHDRESNSELIATLRAVLAQDGHVRGAAKDLGVHENTVRYRLSKIKEISIIDPDRIESLLDLRFCFQILDLAGETTSL